MHVDFLQDNMKHVLSGGTWHDPDAQKWVKAGPDVLEYFDTHPHQRCLLGFPDMKSKVVSAVQLPRPMEATHSIDWDKTEAAKYKSATIPQRGMQFYAATFCRAANGDKAKVGSHTIIKYGQEYQTGCVKEVLVPIQDQCKASHIVVSIFEILPGLHPQLHVPHIRYPTPEQNKVLIPFDIICTINIQYDCPAFGCNLTSLVVEKQECMLTLWVKTFVEHASMNIYVINMSSIHNYQWIKAAIPSVLYDKIYMPLILDLNCLHAKAAQVLQSKKDGKLAGDFKMSHEPSSMEPDLSQPKKRQPICGNGKGNGKAQTNANSWPKHAKHLKFLTTDGMTADFTPSLAIGFLA
ncbi:hypothetical protein V8E55_002337 [Tylopilus felleus]